VVSIWSPDVVPKTRGNFVPASVRRHRIPREFYARICCCRAGWLLAGWLARAWGLGSLENIPSFIISLKSGGVLLRRV